MTQLKGIDISHHNVEPVWGVLSKNIDFIYHKATEASNYTDPYCVSRINKAHKAGLHTGVYHFARFSSVADAKAEAAHFIEVVKNLPIDLPYVLDIETDDAKLSVKDLTAACVAFLEAVKAAFKKPVAVYTYDAFIAPNLSKELGQYPLWLADYGDHKLSPNSVWNRFLALQYTEHGKVLGINGGVDMDWLDDSLVIKPETPKPAAPKKITHKVVAGETLSKIAAEHKTTVDSLVKLNGIKDKDLIKVGQTLKIN